MELHVKLTIESILDLNELKSSMKIQLRTTVTWIDPRLMYKNVHKNKLNLITTSQREKLWTPRLIVESTSEKTEISFHDESSHAEINLEKEIVEKTAELDVALNHRKSFGSDGYVAFSREFTILKL